MANPEGTQDADEPKERKPFLLRLQPELLEELRAWAAQDLRSLNAHIEFLLREAVKKRRGGK
ncbi:MAG: Arc family DNA-binding protein [Planctomycetes bacterium]|nr:Arc family DNA-binding protein [Planctomycetota bacterium]